MRISLLVLLGITYTLLLTLFTYYLQHNFIAISNQPLKNGAGVVMPELIMPESGGIVAKRYGEDFAILGIYNFPKAQVYKNLTLPIGNGVLNKGDKIVFFMFKSKNQNGFHVETDSLETDILGNPIAKTITIQ